MALAPLTDLEIAAGQPLGLQRGAHVLPPPRATARAEAEAELLSGLLRGPLFVSFSGGRDSSAVLALAAHVARKEGLPLPIPVTLDFPGAFMTDEREWQQLVLRSLGIEVAERVRLGSEMNLLGPTARSVLRRHGLLNPPNAHLHVPLLELARGGSLATGIGGDEILGSSFAGPTAAVVARRRRPTKHDLRVLSFQGLARPAARAVYRRREDGLPWLRPTSQRRSLRLQSQLWQAEWQGWPPKVEVFARSRYYAKGQEAFAALSSAYDVQPLHPLYTPPFMASLISEGGRLGFGGRTEAMTHLVGDLLPSAVLERQSKAEFSSVVWAAEAAAFRRGSALEAVSGRHVLIDALRVIWDGAPHYATALLLQHAWLSAGCPELAPCGEA